MLLLCGELDIFPIHGYYDYVKWAHPLSLPEIPFFLADLLRHLAVPTLSFVLGLFGFYYIMARSSVVDIVNRDFVRLAKAKGLSIREIMFKHEPYSQDWTSLAIEDILTRLSRKCGRRP